MIEANAAQVGAIEAGAVEAGMKELGAPEPGAFEAAVGGDETMGDRTAKIRAREGGFMGFCSAESRAAEARSGEVGPSENCPTEIDAACICTAQNRALEPRARESAAAQRHFTQVDLGQIGADDVAPFKMTLLRERLQDRLSGLECASCLHQSLIVSHHPLSGLLPRRPT